MNIFDIILQWIGAYLGWLDRITGSYMVALLLFALTVEILLIPLAIRRQKSSIDQARLQPKVRAIQKKYAGRNDQVTLQKMQQEIMAMREKEGVSQFAGCLPMIIQLPVVLALYQIVIDPLKYVLKMPATAINTIKTYMTSSLGIEFGNRGGTIELISKIKEAGLDAFSGLDSFTAEGINLETASEAYESLANVYDKLPDFTIFGGAIDLGAIPSFTNFNWLLLVPVLTFVAYFFSMRITRKLSYQVGNETADPKALGCSNTMMDIMMPLFSVYITFVVPAAIGVYWIFKSVLSTIEHVILYKLMPMPKFTEEDFKAAEKELAGKNKNRPVKKERDPNAPRPRSLHHIDDEDYDEHGNYIALPEKSEIKAEDTPVEIAPLKVDERLENKEDAEPKSEASEAESEDK